MKNILLALFVLFTLNSKTVFAKEDSDSKQASSEKKDKDDKKENDDDKEDSKNKTPVINAYISLLDPQHMDTLRVDISKSTIKSGKIVRTEINFGDGYVGTNLKEVHKYQNPGLYLISITVYSNKNISANLKKQIEVNKDFKISEVSSAVVFSNTNLINNRSYSFNLTNTQAAKLYILTLTHINTQNIVQNLLGLGVNTFTANVSLNGLDLFSTNEITASTTTIQRLVYLQNTNQLTATFSPTNNNQIGVSMKEVIIVRDTTAPVITLDIQSNSVTNFRFRLFEIEDQSSTLTRYHVNNDPDTQTTEKTNLAVDLKEGVNSIVFVSEDSFGNTSTLNINNVILDTHTPNLVSTTPASDDETIYTNVLPKNYNLSATFDEKLTSLTVNGQAANLSADGKTGNLNLQLSTGVSALQIVATDVAGNQTTINRSINVIFSNTPPVINLGLNDGYISNSSNLYLPILIQSGIPTTLIITVNGVIYATTDDTDFPLPLNNLPEGVNVISVTSTDAAGNAASATISILVDTKAPLLTSISPASGQTFYTNHLPLVVPITAQFSEVIASANIPGNIAILTSPNTVTSTVQISTAGVTTISISTTDLAGNVTTITENINVEYSNATPHLTLATSLNELLTNQISIPVSGTSDQVLTSATLNGVPISISSDGLSFSGTFEVPHDGRYELSFIGTDRYGNVGTVSTHIRVLQNLPPTLVNPEPPTLTNNYPTNYQVDYGTQYTPDVCDQLDAVFNSSTEFSDSLQQVISVDPSAYANMFPKDYNINVADTSAVENFIGDKDEKLNYIKAGYLVMCKGINIMPNTNCAQNRKLYRLIMGEYPEPMIIRKIPALPISVQNFLIPRVNICTGFDSSNLSCKDMIEIVPLIANFVVPGLGEILGSPAGQFVMDQAICKDKCSQPIVKDSPLCTDYKLPEIPDVALPSTNISFTPPVLPGNITVGIGDWSGGSSGGSGGGSAGGGGNGSGSGCGGFFSSCGGDSGSGSFGYICSIFPKLYACGNNAGVTNFPDYGSVDVASPFNCSSVSTFSDIVNIADTQNIPFTYVLNSVVANCLTSPVPGFPHTAKPIITLIEPVQDQVADQTTVRVRGYVNSIGSSIKINGIDTSSWLSSTGQNFDVVIPIPSNGIVKVEAADTWGNLADAVEVGLANQTVAPLDFSFSVSDRNLCVLKDEKIKCLGLNESGALGFANGYRDDDVDPFTDFTEDVIGASSGVTSLDVVGESACAVINNEIKCWGFNYSRALFGPDNQNINSSFMPVTIQHPEGIIKKVVMGSGSSCAIIDSGLGCWGNGSAVTQAFSLINTTGDTVVDVSVGASTICYTNDLNLVKCFGFSQLVDLFNPDGINNEVFAPTQVSSLENKVTAVAVNNFSTCVVDNKKVKCWGLFYHNDTVVNNELLLSVPTEILTLNSNITKLESSSSNSDYCVLQNKAIKCWGGSYIYYGTNFYLPIDLALITPVTIYGFESGVDDFDVDGSSNGNQICAVQFGQLKCTNEISGQFNFNVNNF